MICMLLFEPDAAVQEYVEISREYNEESLKHLPDIGEFSPYSLPPSLPHIFPLLSFSLIFRSKNWQVLVQSEDKW